MTEKKGFLLRLLENPASSFSMSLPLIAILLFVVIFGKVTCDVKEYTRALQKYVDLEPEVEQLNLDEFATEDEIAEAAQLEEDKYLEESMAAPETELPEDLPTPEIAPLLTDLDQRLEVRQIVVDQEALDNAAFAELPTEDRNRTADTATSHVRSSQNTMQVADVDAAGVSPDAGIGTEPVPASGAGVSGPGDRGIATDGAGSALSISTLGDGLGVAGDGIGIGQKMSDSEAAFRRWILKNLRPLPPPVRRALDFDPDKDKTAKDIVEYDGDYYELFFLYREDENLLRFIVLRDRTAFYYALPGFVLETTWVQKGSVMYGVPRAEGVRPDPIEISLRPVDTITEELDTIMRIVLSWLEIANDD